MAPSSKVAAVMNGQPMINNSGQSSTLQAPAVGADTGDKEFAPSVWGDFFVTYVPPVSQACS